MDFNENVTVNGNLSARRIDGELGKTALSAILKRFEHVDAELTDMRDSLASAVGKSTGMQSTIEKLAESYNKAIEVINDLEQRVAALEANYDPTIIK